MNMKSWTARLGLALLAAIAAAAAAAQTLRFGLAEDPDVLDPTLARTFVGRIVFASLCDKLFDIDEKLNIVPQLATCYEWSADSKALTLEAAQRRHLPRRREIRRGGGQVQHRAAQDDGRARTGAASWRRSASVDVVDASTVRLNLSAPFAPLLAALADRAGMMVSPKAAQAEGDKFGAKPVCSGPFRFVERVAQDRIVLERYPNYWNKGEIHLDRIVYTPIPDATVRLANLRSGQLDFIERMAASDVPQLKTDSRFKVAKITEIGYQGITINVGKSDLAQKNPLGPGRAGARSVRALARPRRHRAGRRWTAKPTSAISGSPRATPTTRRTCRFRSAMSRAPRSCCARPGVPNPSFTLVTPTTSDAQKIAQVVQAMAKEAGFDVKIQATEFATSLDMADKGQFEAYVLAWSGRADPDGNLFSFDACKQPLNYAGYCKPEVDELLNRSRTTLDPAERDEGRSNRSPRSCSRTARSSTCSIATGCGRTPPSSPACA